MKNLFVMLHILLYVAITALAVSCSEPTEPDSLKKEKKEKYIRLKNGKSVPLSEYEEMKAAKNGSNPYVKDTSASNSGRPTTQYHSVERIDPKTGATIVETSLDELPDNAVQRNVSGSSRHKKQNGLIIPDSSSKPGDIYNAPRLKKKDIIITDDVLNSAPPELRMIYVSLMKEVKLLKSELKDANSKLDRVEGKIDVGDVRIPYEVKRTQVLEEILSHMRQRMIDRSVYPLEDIPSKYLEYYTIDGCDDRVLEEMEKEVSYIIELIAKSMSFDQKKIFNSKIKNPRDILRLNYEDYLRKKHKRRK